MGPGRHLPTRAARDGYITKITQPFHLPVNITSASRPFSSLSITYTPSELDRSLLDISYSCKKWIFGSAARRYDPYEVLVVGINRGRSRPRVQRLWDGEQLQTVKTMQKGGLVFSWNALLYMRRPREAVLTNLIVKFVDLNCKYVFVISNGVGQWLYEPLFSNRKPCHTLQHSYLQRATPLLELLSKLFLLQCY